MNEPSLVEKATRLLDYLLRLASLHTKRICDIAEYEKVLWVSSVPHERGCFAQAWGRDEEHEPDEWLEVQNRRELELPTVPAPCEDWVNLAVLQNKNDPPVLFPEITRYIPNPAWVEESDQPETIPHTERLEDRPEIQRTWDRYIEDKWLPWTEEHNTWEKVHRAYSSLFAIHQDQLRLGEEYELVLGIGLLTWQTPTGQRVRRHLVIADALLKFEARLGKFAVRPHTEGAKLRPELDMLDIEEQPARAEETAVASLTTAEDDPWEQACVEGVLQALVHSINSQGDYDGSLDASNCRASAKAIIEADLVDCIVALPGQLFYTTAIPVCLWFLTRNKGANKERGFRARPGETLFIDARKMGELTDRTHRELTEEGIAKIAGTYHAWRTVGPHPGPLPGGEGGNNHYRGGFDLSGLAERARELRRKQTPAESVMWELLRNRHFLKLKFCRQHQIGEYVADFYCDELKLVVELDGPVHGKKTKKDKKRDGYMASLGLTVLRFSNADFLADPKAALQAIAAKLLPSPHGRGGGGEGNPGMAAYADIPGFCKSAKLKEIEAHGHVLTPGRYVGAEEIEDDGIPFEEKMAELSAELYEQMNEAEERDAAIRQNLEVLGYGE